MVCPNPSRQQAYRALFKAHLDEAFKIEMTYFGNAPVEAGQLFRSLNTVDRSHIFP
jgi:hypothetical protein